MMQEIITRIFGFMLLAGAGAGLVGIVAAGVFDLKTVIRRPHTSRVMRKLRRKSAQPPVTVVVYAHNDAETITDCLAHLRRSMYRNFDLVVVDNASRDGTRRTVRRFMRTHPRFTMRLYAKSKQSPLHEVLRSAYQKSRKGELVITLAASSRPSKSFITEAVARLMASPDMAGLVSGEALDPPLTINDLVPEVVRAAKHIAMKSLGLLKTHRGRAGLNGAYRSQLIKSGAAATIRYDGSLLLPVARRVRRPAGAPRRHQLLWFVLAVGVFLLMSYAMVTAAILVSPIPLILSWSIVTVGSLASVWSDESIRLMQKLQLTFAATLIYFLSYVALIGFLLRQMTQAISWRHKPASLRQPWPTRRRAIS